MTKKKKTATRSKRKTKAQQAHDEEIRQWITIVILSALTIVGYMKMGFIGEKLSELQRFIFGKYYFVIMMVIIAQILVTIYNRKNGNTLSKNPLAIVLIVLAILLWCSYSDTDHSLKGLNVLRAYIQNPKEYFTLPLTREVGGGLIGAVLLSGTTLLVDYNGTVLVIAVLFIIAAILLVSLDVYKQAFNHVKEYFSTVEIYEDDDDEEYGDDDEYEDAGPYYTEPVPAALPAKEQPEPQKQLSLKIDETAKLEGVTIPRAVDADAPPVQRSPLDIRVDNEPDIEDMVPSRKVPVEEAVQRTVFMSIDDLIDHQNQPQAVVRTVKEPVPYTPEPEPAEEPEPVFEEFEPEEPEEEIVPAPAPRHAAAPKPKQSSPLANAIKSYRLPKETLLDPVPRSVNDDLNAKAAKEKGELLIQVLNNFDIKAELIDTHIGPAVTKYEIRPEVGVKVSKILSLADDIKMQLAVKDVRIEAPIPGHYAVGIEIPNVKATPVKMKELVRNAPDGQEQPMLFFLGKDLLGNTVTCRLDKMPHLLIAGATGSGKSVCMNAIITSFLLRTKPDEVKLLLVDPKKVEFTPYKRVPHLIGPVINDAAQASNALKVIVKIMDDRYDKFSKNGVRNIQTYNEKVKQGKITRPDDQGNEVPEELMPYIVVIIDELADLMIVAGKEVESSIQRITQLARAAGIHLIVATQRPSTDVITGIIKANIPSRIAFSVSSGIDSRTILDHVGAERLLGNGDMLYMPIGESNALRVQGVYVTDEEVARITEDVSNQATPFYDDAFVRLEGVEGNDGTAVISSDDDPMFEQIKDYVIEAQKASTSLLQRRFGIGYNRAARMIDMLEAQGVIGPAQGSKPRDVYIKKETSEE